MLGNITLTALLGAEEVVIILFVKGVKIMTVKAMIQVG